MSGVKQTVTLNPITTASNGTIGDIFTTQSGAEKPAGRRNNRRASRRNNRRASRRNNRRASRRNNRPASRRNNRKH